MHVLPHETEKHDGIFDVERRINMGTRNKMMDLNDHLFEQMERLNDNDLKGDKLKEEITRAKSMSGIANQIIQNARVCVEAAKAYNDGTIKRFPKMLGLKENDEI